MSAQTISVLAPWPTGAAKIQLGGITIDSPVCSVSSGSIKSDSANTTPQLVNTGPSSRRFDIVVLGDGYVSGEQGKFKIDAQRLADAILDLEPYKSYRHLINIWYVPSVSRVSGPGINGVSIDTNYRCKYGNHGIHRLLLCDTLRAREKIKDDKREFQPWSLGLCCHAQRGQDTRKI